MRKMLQSKSAMFFIKVACRVPDPHISGSKRLTGTASWKSVPCKQPVMNSFVLSVSKGSSHETATTSVSFTGNLELALGCFLQLSLSINVFIGPVFKSFTDSDSDNTLSATNLASASIVGYSNTTVDGRSSLYSFPTIWVSSTIPRESSPISMSGSSLGILAVRCWVYCWAERWIKSTTFPIEIKWWSRFLSECPCKMCSSATCFLLSSTPTAKSSSS